MNYLFEQNELSYPSYMSCKKNLRTKALDREVYQKSTKTKLRQKLSHGQSSYSSSIKKSMAKLILRFQQI